MTQVQPNSANKSDTKPPPAPSDHLHNILGSKYITIPILGAALGGVLGASLKGQNRISDETSFMFPVAGALLALTTVLAQEQENAQKKQKGWFRSWWSGGSSSGTNANTARPSGATVYPHLGQWAPARP